MVNRGDVFEEIGIQNKWKWEWLSKIVKVGETDKRIGKLTFAKSMCVEQQDALSVPKMLHTAIGNRGIENIKKKEGI